MSEPADSRPASTQISDLTTLKDALRKFASERDWERFHSPKNLAMALSGEAGELAAVFQWLTEAQSRELDEHTLASARDEIADVLIYLVRIADQLDIDLVEAVRVKVADNARRYPASAVVGSAKKRGR